MKKLIRVTVKLYVTEEDVNAAHAALVEDGHAPNDTLLTFKLENLIGAGLSSVKLAASDDLWISGIEDMSDY